MKFLMSRFGGHGVVVGSGKASDSLLPQDQSLDNMLDTYAKEIIPNFFYISSYDAIPEYMGMLEWNQFGKKPVKLGTLSHNFTELLLQYDLSVTTDIFITKHQYDNVYAVIIKTHKEELESINPDYFESYDYVLQLFIRSKNQKPKLRTEDIERILLILFYKMNLIYEGYIEEFSPSKTHLGKLISSEFCDAISSLLVAVDTDEQLAELLQKYTP